MLYFYFFENDKECKWMKKEIDDLYPLFLHEPVSMEDIKANKMKLINEFEGKIKFYMILQWVWGKTRGANLEWLAEIGVNYVKTVNDLPPNSGIYITGYDRDLVEYEELKKRGVPIIDHACPWVLRLKDQILNVPDTKQMVLMIDEDHMVYNCYQSIFPKDIIIISPEKFEEEIASKRNGKPLYFAIYAVFRKKDAERVVDFINKNYPHPDNDLDMKRLINTLCCWVHQGVFEELADVVKKHIIKTIWLICSSTGDRSTMSLINDIKELNLEMVVIRNQDEVPISVTEDSRIGVLLAPIPVSSKIKGIISLIKDRFANKG